MVFLEVWNFFIIHYFLLRMLRSGCHVASFPGLLRLQFLIACSMQKWREKAREFRHVIRGTADVTDSRRNSLFTFVVCYREARESKQVPEER